MILKVVRKIKICGGKQFQETGESLGQDLFSEKGEGRATSYVERMGKVGGYMELGTEMEQLRYKHQGTALALTEGNGLTPIDVNEG